MRLLLTGEGTAELVETDGEVVLLSATRSSPPGSILTGTDEVTGVAYKIKVRACRREAEGKAAFRIEGRFVDLTRAMREVLMR